MSDCIFITLGRVQQLYISIILRVYSRLPTVLTSEDFFYCSISSYVSTFIFIFLFLKGDTCSPVQFPKIISFLKCKIISFLKCIPEYLWSFLPCHCPGFQNQVKRGCHFYSTNLCTNLKGKWIGQTALLGKWLSFVLRVTSLASNCLSQNIM